MKNNNNEVTVSYDPWGFQRWRPESCEDKDYSSSPHNVTVVFIPKQSKKRY